MGIIVAMGSFPLAAMEVPSKNDKNQLCGIDKLVFNRWVIEQATEELFEDRFCKDIKNKINSLEFDLIYLFKFPIPSIKILTEFVDVLENKKNHKNGCMYIMFHKNIIYHRIDYKIDGVSFYVECADHRNPVYPLISKENTKFKDIKIGEGLIPDSYYLLIHYQNGNHSNFHLYCEIPYLYKEALTPFHIHDFYFYIKNPEMTPLIKTEGWKTYKKHNYEKREFHKLTPLKKSFYVTYEARKHTAKNKKFLGKLLSLSAQPREKEEIDNSHPEDFYLYFLRK